MTSSTTPDPSAAPLPAADSFDIVVVGGGAAGIGISAHLLKADGRLRIAVIEPADFHTYQPGLTLVGAGVFKPELLRRRTAALMPAGAVWIKAQVTGFEPERNQVQLDGKRMLQYQQLIVCPGLRLAWEEIPGLQESLGTHGVTSNYRADLAAYTWQLVRDLRRGTALFTQPSMPIKCAGAPQKALYLACDHWRRRGVLKAVDAQFHSAGAVLFGVAHFVPALSRYIARYGVDLQLNSRLIAVDGRNKIATFEVSLADGGVRSIDKTFDMLHVVPPQRPHHCVSASPLADDAGWLKVDPASLQHVTYANVFGLGDACGTSNAKTAAAVRNQIRVVSANLLAIRAQRTLPAAYDGYGACPLTVEKGKVILAEFGYGGALLPSFPFDARVARRSMWWLKASFLPWFYWNRLLKGRG